MTEDSIYCGGKEHRKLKADAIKARVNSINLDIAMLHNNRLGWSNCSPWPTFSMRQAGSHGLAWQTASHGRSAAAIRLPA